MHDLAHRDDPPHKTASLLFVLCGAVLLLSLLLGGGTHSGFLGDVITEIVSVALLMAAFWPLFDENSSRTKVRLHFSLAACAICVLVVLVQLLPLPFDISAGNRLLPLDNDPSRLSLKQNWTTLSLAPQASWAAALSFIPPLAIFCTVIQLSFRQRMMLCWAILGIGGASLLVGYIQVAQGPESPLRFYSFTNPSEAVGFFANRNHFAAFLNIAVVLAGVLLAQRIEAALQHSTMNTASFFWLAGAGAFFVALVTGLAMARSRAGVFLAIIAIAGIVAMIVRCSREPLRRVHSSRRRTSRITFAVAVFAALFALQLGLGRLLDRFDTDVADDLRLPLNVTTLETAFKAMPFGTGLGSFVPVYASVERPKDVITSFANRAHDDLAEFLLETGIVGAILVVAFLGWFSRRLFTVWIRPRPEIVPVVALLDCASSLIVILLLLHSLVDYPLRTTAISALFAFFCGVLAVPAAQARSSIREPPKTRRRSRPRAMAVSPLAPDRDLVWPEDWLKPSAPTPSPKPPM